MSKVFTDFLGGVCVNKKIISISVIITISIITIYGISEIQTDEKKITEPRINLTFRYII